MVVTSYRKGVQPSPTFEPSLFMPQINPGRPMINWFFLTAVPKTDSPTERRNLDSSPLMKVVMEEGDLIVGIALVTGTLALLFASILAVFFCCRRRKSGSSDLESEPPAKPTPTRSNGFLSLKTPLISTKALG
ncbi:uncharacterized protein [Halyomorpha halys]|uniref:uncharacterized protein n=1 Tax=Halyomorpha halys TaxID=286706 RepID=UPI0034D20807